MPCSARPAMCALISSVLFGGVSRSRLLVSARGCSSALAQLVSQLGFVSLPENVRDRVLDALLLDTYCAELGV